MRLGSSASGLGYRFEFGDLIAGISVALVAVPQGVAYATLAGLPAVCGLYASIFPPLLAALFASSRYLQTGPSAMTSMLTFAALSSLAVPMSANYVGSAALLALVVGLVRVVGGMLGAGFVAYLMSQPVIVGFTSAAALLIIGSQVPSLLGVVAPGDGIVAPAIRALAHPGQWSLPAIGMGLMTIAGVFLARRTHPLVPGVLIAGIVGVLFTHYGGYAGPVVGTLPSGLPALSLALPWGELPHLIVPGLVIAVVGFAEPAAVSRTLATRNRQPWNASRELLSQGMANVAAGLTGGLPVGGSFARTTLGRLAGGRTPWTGAVSGLTVLVFMPFAAVLADLPRAILAGTVIVSVVNVARLGPLARITRASRAQAAVGWTTFVLTIVLAPRIDLAVLVGIGLGVGVHLWREQRILISSDYDEGTASLTLEPIGVLYFGSANVLDDALIGALGEHPNARRLVIDLRKIGRIDYTGALVLLRVAEDATLAGLEVKIVPGRPPQGVRLLERVFGHDSPWIARSDT